MTKFTTRWEGSEAVVVADGPVTSSNDSYDEWESLSRAMLQAGATRVRLETPPHRDDSLQHDMARILQIACDADEADPRELLSEIAQIASKHPWPKDPRPQKDDGHSVLEKLMREKYGLEPKA